MMSIRDIRVASRLLHVHTAGLFSGVMLSCVLSLCGTAHGQAYFPGFQQPYGSSVPAIAAGHSAWPAASASGVPLWTATETSTTWASPAVGVSPVAQPNAFSATGSFGTPLTVAPQPALPRDDYITVDVPYEIVDESAGTATIPNTYPAEPVIDVQSLHVQDVNGELQLVMQMADPPVPVPDSKPDAGAAQGTSSGDSSESFGEAPVDTSYQFLRRVSPLLEEGDCQFDVGVRYNLFENDLPVLIDFVPDPDVVVEGRLRTRLVVVPFALRYGLSEDTQLFINVPVGWSHGELSFPGFDTFDNVKGIGDITLGASCLLGVPCPGSPDIVGTLALTLPTGNATFTTVLQQPGAQLGRGFFGVAGSLLYIHSYDPLVIYYGPGLRSEFENSFNGGTFDVHPGLEMNYRFGVGFAVNDKVTLSSTLFGSFITETTINGQKLPNSSLEPVSIQLAVTYADQERIQEPFVEFGITDDATSVNLGWICTY